VHKRGALWAEIERDAHRFVVDLVENNQHAADAELIASRVLLARSDISASLRDAYLEPLAEVVRKYLDVLQRQP
jgi:hypothetical protein